MLACIPPEVVGNLVLPILLNFDCHLPLYYSSWGLKNSISSYFSCLLLHWLRGSTSITTASISESAESAPARELAPGPHVTPLTSPTP